MSEALPTRTPLDPGYMITPKDLEMSEDQKKQMNDTPVRNALGAIGYMVHTRWEITLFLHVLARHTASPCPKMWAGIKQLLKYLNSTKDRRRVMVKCPRILALILTCFVDAAYSPPWSPHAKSITCVMIFLGSCMVHFEVKAQSVVAQSSTEAEIIAFSLAVRRLHYIIDILDDLGLPYTKCVIYEDNQSAIRNFTGYQLGDLCKHIRTKFWYCKESVALPRWSLRNVSTHFQLADIGTKILIAGEFHRKLQLIDSFNPAEDYSKMAV